MAQSIQDNIPGFLIESIVFEGEGDFCLAYTVNEDWIFRFAHNREGSKSLEREASLLPKLAPVVRLAIPNIAYFGHRDESGLAFVGYPKIKGVELTGELLHSLEPSKQEQCARDLAGFLTDLHSFSVGVAQQLGVLACSYPFCRTEDGIMEGSAADLYLQELERLLSYPLLDDEARQYCKWLVGALLDGTQDGELPPALIHGDLSQDHALFDPQRERIAGVIDFTDVIVGTPLLDLMYLYHAYGKEFLALLLLYYHDGAHGQEILGRVQLMHRWYIALRLLWALDHEYEPGIRRELKYVEQYFCVGT